MTRRPERPEHAGLDPRRWADAPPSGPGVETELGAAVRALPPTDEPDDLRLAQLRQRIVQRAVAPARFPFAWGLGRSARLRAAAFALGFVLLGGLTTAVAARVYLGRWQRDPVVAPLPSGAEREARPSKPRRWRMAVRDQAQLDFSFGPAGAEVAVVGGAAEITGADIPGAVILSPGSSWRDANVAATTATAAPTSRDTPASPATLVPAPHATTGTKALVMPPTRPTTTPPPSTSPSPGASPAAPATTHTPRATLAMVATTPAPQPTPVISATTPTPPSSRPPEARSAATQEEEPRPWALPTAPSPSQRASTGEAALMATAFRFLRRDHAPREALAKLDEHRHRFPRGELAREAALARVEALLALGRAGDALAVLDPLALDVAGLDRKPALARAELRAERGRCAEALGDLATLVAGYDDVAASALYQRSRCEVRLGDLTNARDDLGHYLRRFSSGSQRDEVVALLRRLGD